MDQMVVSLTAFDLERFVQGIEDFISQAFYDADNPVSMIQIVEHCGYVVPVPDDVPRNPVDEIREGLSVLFPFTSIIDEGPVACADGNSYTVDPDQDTDQIPSESLLSDFREGMDDDYDYEGDIFPDEHDPSVAEYLSYYGFLLSIQDRDLLIRSVKCVPSPFAQNSYKAFTVDEMGVFEDAGIAFIELFIMQPDRETTGTTLSLQ
jgi:hypothetical protein